MRRLHLWITALGSIAILAGCGSPTEVTTVTTSVPSSASTSTVPPSTPTSAHYVGPIATPTQPSATLDLSVFFDLPRSASRIGRSLAPAAIHPVTGGFNTGPGGFEGTVEGDLDGTPPSGTFAGVLRVILANGCSAARNYTGPLTADRVNWVAGIDIDTCGGTSPLTFPVSAPASQTPPTTTVPTTTTTIQGLAVTRATASVTPSSFGGSCPGVFNFSAAITANGRGAVTYRWERSDGATGPTETLNFDASGTQTVTTSWTLSANGSFWERVHILTPNDLFSNQASFTNSCGSGGGGFAVTASTASVTPASFSGACPGVFNFSGVITTNGAGTVTYRWERSDGATGPTETLSFNGAGTQTVTTSWTLGANGSFWERVHVLTPNDLFSNQASFTNSCGSSFAVTGSTASVSPSSFSGACPGVFNFSAAITTNGAGTVTYRWERSDGATGPTETLSFNGAGTQTVTTSWTLGANGSFSERVHVLTPNDLFSNQASFTNSCGSSFAVTGSTASVSPSSFSGACPGVFNFSAAITTNGAGTVTYRWERSDGATGPTETLSFNGAGTQTVTTSWTLGANGSFSERVHVLTPNDLFSNQASFTNSCGSSFAVTGSTASVSPSSFSGACPGVFNFSGVITTNGAGTVTYRWERSDGATGPTGTLSFAGAGTQTVTTSWTLGANGSFWERVHVLTPNDLFSNQSTFSNSCR